MEEMMHLIFSILAAAAAIYSILILIRVILSWFGNFVAGGKIADFLFQVTDPYLNWWRRNFNIRIGFLDFSVVAAIAFLSLIQILFYSISRFERITVGYILVVVLMTVWNVISFILMFCIVIVTLRLIAYLANFNIYSPFWRAVDSISQPLLYRINRIFFGNRIVNYLKGIIISLIVLAVFWAGGKFLIPVITGLLLKIPV